MLSKRLYLSKLLSELLSIPSAWAVLVDLPEPPAAAISTSRGPGLAPASEICRGLQFRPGLRRQGVFTETGLAESTQQAFCVPCRVSRLTSRHLGILVFCAGGQRFLAARLVTPAIGDCLGTALM